MKTTISIFHTNDHESIAKRLSRLRRKGLVSTDIRWQGDEKVVLATVKAGSDAEIQARFFEERGDRLRAVREAIEEKRAYLDTAFGRRTVTGYDDRTGDCHTNNTAHYHDARTFLVTLEDIKTNG